MPLQRHQLWHPEKAQMICPLIDPDTTAGKVYLNSLIRSGWKLERVFPSGESRQWRNR